MQDAEANIRESLLSTLSFLASEAKQEEFATKVPYEAYQDEFACWWFDTFFPEETSALRMFNPDQLVVLVSFSEDFGRNLSAIGSEHLTIAELLSKPEWKAVIANAKEAQSRLKIAT